ncbi:MAG TPA: tetratricopeptide repeat protein [Terriglobales bacterium]|nr:tetratricopeptide repeat protein [Terriglobales bacterium]
MHKQHIRLGLLAMLAAFAVWQGVAVCQTAPMASSPARDTVEAHLGKGYDALRQDRYEVAASEFRAALKLDSNLVERARFPLGIALFEMHKAEEARREFETVRREVGDHPNVLYYLGRLDIDEGKFDSAIRNLNQAAEKPPFPDTAYYLGYAYLKQADLPSAEKWLKEAIRLNPNDSRMPYQLGIVYRKQGREEEAEQTMAGSEALRRRDSERSQLRLECAQKLDRGPREEARAVCEQLYDPDNPNALTELGTIYAQHGDVEAALKPLQRAAELAPESPQTQYNLALAYYHVHQFAEARGPLASALKRWPDLFQLNALYGAVLMELGEDLPAYQALHHAHELNTEDSGTAGLLYMAALKLGKKGQTGGQYPDALRYLQEAAKLQPQEPEPHQVMSEIYAQTSRPAQARAEQEEANRLAKNGGSRLH